MLLFQRGMNTASASITSYVQSPQCVGRLWHVKLRTTKASFSISLLLRFEGKLARDLIEQARQA